MACRGTGQVISNLGGQARQATCPWCRGHGLRIPGSDAQAHWGEAAGSDAPEGAEGSPAQTTAASPVGPGTDGGDERPTPGDGEAPAPVEGDPAA